MTTAPGNIEAERAVLGSCLIDRDAILAVAPLVGVEDFQQHLHQAIYAAILELYYAKTPADLLTVIDHLRTTGKLEKSGGEVYLSSLIDAMTTSVHAAYYADIVSKHATRRRVIQAGQHIVKLGYDAGLSIDELLTEAESQVQAASEGRQAGVTESLGDVLDSYVATIGNGPRQFTTFGHRRIDDLLGGMEPGTVTIVAGRPSHGKTGFAFGVAMHVAGKLGRRAMMVSLEMSNEQMVHRALSLRTGLDSRKIRARHFDEHQEWMVSEAAKQIHDWPIEFSKAWGDEVTRICNQVRSYHAARGLDLLIVDGLWLMSWSGAKGNRVQEVGKISRLMKLLALDLEIPIMVCHQLNRAMVTRKEQTPILSDLRESGDVEQDADVVLFVHRPGLMDESGQTPKDFAHIIVAKNRQGPVGRIPMRFNELTTEFFDADPKNMHMVAD